MKDLEGDELNCAITINFDEDEYLFEEEKHELKGYDYKEVINLSNRTWIKNEEKRRERNKGLISENPFDLKIKAHSLSEGMPHNHKNINLDNEKKEFYLHNPNPFLNEINLKKLKVFGEDKNIEIKNPFYNKKINESKNNKVKLLFHRAITLHQQKVEESNNKNKEIIKDSKLNEIFKTKSFKIRMAELSNDIHNESINRIFNKENNNIDFSLIPFYILDEVIPIEINERDKKATQKKIRK